MNVNLSPRLLLAFIFFGSAVLVGCGSGESDVAPEAMSARNRQRAAAPEGQAPGPGAGATGK